MTGGVLCQTAVRPFLHIKQRADGKIQLSLGMFTTFLQKRNRSKKPKPKVGRRHHLNAARLVCCPADWADS
jgi:hypothetical protein